MFDQIPVHAGHWFMGSARELFPHIHRFIARIAARYGGIVRFRIFNRVVYATVRPEDAQRILVDNVDGYIKSFHYRNVITGEGLLASSGDTWRQHRRKVQRSFKRASLQPVVKIAAEECEATLKHWPNLQDTDGIIDVIPEMRAIALRAMARALLGYDLTLNYSAQLQKNLMQGMAAVGRRNNGAALPLWLPTPTNRTIKRVSKALKDTLLTEVAQRRKAIRTGAPTPGGMIDKYVGDEELTDLEVYDETATLFVAGFETSATALAWTLAMLARNPDVTDACCREIDNLLNGRQVTANDLPSLPMITAVYEETLRLYPPIVQVGRESIDNDELSGYALPKGSTIIISFFGLHRSPDLWDRPDTFDPSRFLPERRHEVPTNAYYPFGLGRRTCIGNYFAYQEQIAILTTILQRYRLENPPGTMINEALRLTLQPGTELPLRLISRLK
ncbi:MAG: cytochrome P450 [Rhodospirillales bacterium]